VRKFWHRTGAYSTRVLSQVERRLDQAEGRIQQLTQMAE